MSRLENNHFSSAQYAFKPILRNKTPEEWIISNVSDLLSSSEQDKPPIDITSKKLLKNRKIKYIDYIPRYPGLGNLIVEEDGFVIKVIAYGRRLGNWQRLIIAHEVAHTYFYDIRKSPPLKLINLEKGNRDLEKICRYMSKSILVPKHYILLEVSNNPTPTSTKFSLDIIGAFAKNYDVPWQIMAERIVEDLKLWKCVIMQFNLMSDDKGKQKNKNENIWRLKWRTVAKLDRDNIFIPSGKKKEGRNYKISSCKKSIITIIK